MEKPVLGKGLGESLGFSEDGGPLLNGSDVLIHVLACGESGGELVDALANFGESGNIAAILDPGHGELDVMDNISATSVAGFELREMVISGHSVNETGDEVGHRHGLDLVSLLNSEDG